MSILPNLVCVEDACDPRLHPYRNVRERDLARDDHLFIAEGRVVLHSLLESAQFSMHSVFVSQKRIERDADLLARVPEEVPIFALPQRAMDSVAGFPIHRGLLAAGHRTAPRTTRELLNALPSGPCTLLVLEALTNTDNVGACFRNAAALGADAVILDDRCCDPLYRKALRVSVGHALRVPFANADSMDTILTELSQTNIKTMALAPSARALILDRPTRPDPRLALILGTEGKGLEPATLKRADWCAAIPMSRNTDSLNVATCGALALFATRLNM